MLPNESAYNGEPRSLLTSEGNTVGSLTETRLDPVTTEAARPRQRVLLGFPANLWPLQHADPSPRFGQGEDIVYAIRNDGDTCDVGSSHPGAAVSPKGWAVRPLKRYVSWVQNVDYTASSGSNPGVPTG
jgi:hypothetical protein